ncbi:MAG TPA: winged helix-turn-helix domain-containing protein [Steroidobacteraceae bacterium]
MGAEQTPAAVAASSYRINDLVVDVGSRKVIREDLDLAISGLSFDLLLALVRAAPDLVSFDALLDQVWPGVVVGPDVVTQRVKLLRQTLGDSAENPRYILAVRGHGYRMPFAALPPGAAPPSRAGVSAGAQGAHGRSDPPPVAPSVPPAATAAAPARPPRRWLTPVAAILVLGAAGSWWGIEHARKPQLHAPPQAALLPPDPPATAQPPAGSIAVMPFANLTGDPSKEYLGDGMAEETIHALAGVPGLKVPARTSSFAYKGRNLDIRRIAQDLGVSTILEGSVREAGARIRITAQLVDAQSGYQIWSQSYDRKSADIFKLEDDLAGAIVQAFRTSLKVDLPASTARRPPTQDLDAYRFYLQAESIPNGTPPSFLAAIALYDAALMRDPMFARALEARGFMRAALVSIGYPLAHGLEDAQQDAEQALTLDPTLAEAQAVLGSLYALRGDWPQAEVRFRVAIAADPTDGVMRVQHAAAVLLATGQLHKAYIEAVAGQRLAPKNPFAAAMLAFVEQALGADHDAVKYSELAIAQHGNLAEFETLYAAAAVRRGDYAQAAEHAVKALSPAVLDAGGDEAVRLSYAALADAKRKPAALQALGNLTHEAAWDSMDPRSRQFVIDLYARFGALDRLYEQMNQLLPEGGATHPEIIAVDSLWSPEMAAFRQDSRFQALATRLRLVEYWQKYGPPDQCQLDHARLECH